MARLGPVPRPVEERFWEKVVRKGPNQCWGWSASKHLFGYGKLYIGVRPDGSKIMADAHRYSWELHNRSSVPCGMVVRHTCDNPECTNPRHLVIGMPADNSNDACERGRMGRKLTEESVREIRRRRAAGEKIVPLGAEFGITHAMVSHICTRRTWRHVT